MKFPLTAFLNETLRCLCTTQTLNSCEDLANTLPIPIDVKARWTGSHDDTRPSDTRYMAGTMGAKVLPQYQ